MDIFLFSYFLNTHVEYTIRPGASGLLTVVEYYRVRDSAWIVPYLFITTRTAVGLVDVQGNYPTMME